MEDNKQPQEQPVFLDALKPEEPKDGFLDPNKTVVNNDQNLELIDESNVKSLSFNPFRRSMPKKQIAKKSDQKRKKKNRQAKQARRKNRK